MTAGHRTLVKHTHLNQMCCRGALASDHYVILHIQISAAEPEGCDIAAARLSERYRCSMRSLWEGKRFTQHKVDIDMNKMIAIAAAALLSSAAIASAQTTTPTPGQPGVSAAPGTPNSSNNDPNNPAASRDAEKGGPKSNMGTTGSGAKTGGTNNMTGPATTPAEKSPQRNDPTPDRSKNIQ
jgi:hypothetical protein